MTNSLSTFYKSLFYRLIICKKPKKTCILQMSFRLMHEMWIEKLILVIWTLSIWEETVNVSAVSSHLLYTVKDRSAFYSLYKIRTILIYDQLKNNLINTWSERVICYVVYRLTRTNYLSIWMTMIIADRFPLFAINYLRL